ncbi:MAG TPA: hypothetical protein VIN08_25275 [Ohtaekwangia sp.]
MESIAEQSMSEIAIQKQSSFDRKITYFIPLLSYNLFLLAFKVVKIFFQV